jgi:hypothetical protein
VSLLPVGLYLCAVWESYGAKALFASVVEVTLVKGTIVIEVLARAIFFAIEPLTLILVLVWIQHSALALLDVILPLALVDVSVGVPIPSPALFTVFDTPLVGLTVFEDISAVDELVFKPGAEINVAGRVGVESKP